MRPIYLAQLDKVRPVLILTREPALDYLTSVTVAPIITRICGIHSEVAVGTRNGLDRSAVVSLDNTTTIRRDQLLRPLGFLTAEQERELATAISYTFDVLPTQ
jgi:mRNA interferase MazF